MTGALAVLGRYSKFITAVVGAVTEALNLGLLPTNAQRYVTLAVTILTALGVYAVPNAPSAAHQQLDGRVGALEDQAVSLADLKESFAAGTATAVRSVIGHQDLHAGMSGPAGKWPTAIESPPG